MNHIMHLMPHPVIKPGGFDYKESCHFNMNLGEPVRSGDNICVRLSYVLESSTLRRMIDEGEAEFFLISECASTDNRTVHRTSKYEECVVLPLSENARKLQLRPYIIANNEFHLRCSNEHDAEFKELIPDGVTLPTGSILAVGNPYEIILSKIPAIQAAIALKQDRHVKQGYYEIDLSRDSIGIKMHPETYEKVTDVRKRNKEILYPSLYVVAIEHAMRGMHDHEDRLWVEALKKALTNKGIDYTDPDFKDDVLRHTLTILDGPLNHLAILDYRDEEDE